MVNIWQTTTILKEKLEGACRPLQKKKCGPDSEPAVIAGPGSVTIKLTKEYKELGIC